MTVRPGVRRLAAGLLAAGLLAPGLGCAAAPVPLDDPGRTAPVLRAQQGPPVPVDQAVLEPMSVVDVVFLQQMVPHHEQALAIVDTAVTRSADPAVRGAAEEVGAPLPAELRTMTLWLASVGLAPDGSAGAHAHAGGMSDEDVARVRAASGAELDELLLPLLIDHQVGAVELARSAAATGSNAAVRGLAATIAEREWAAVVALRDVRAGRP